MEMFHAFSKEIWEKIIFMLKKIFIVKVLQDICHLNW